MQVEINDGTFCVDTSLLGELLDIHPADVPTLMRERAITGICERGIDAHAGEFRLMSTNMRLAKFTYFGLRSVMRLIVATEKIAQRERCRSQTQ
jgi:hypothetical protein